MPKTEYKWEEAFTLFLWRVFLTELVQGGSKDIIRATLHNIHCMLASCTVGNGFCVCIYLSVCMLICLCMLLRKTGCFNYGVLCLKGRNIYFIRC